MWSLQDIVKNNAERCRAYLLKRGRDTFYRMYSDGTFSLSGDKLDFPGGYAVAYAGSLVNPSREEFAQWFATLPEETQFLGRWTDENGDEYYERVSYLPKLSDAMEMGRQEGQRYLWDFANAREIACNV